MKPHLDVTVVIPSYNARSTIARAIHSVILQTQRPKEIIIVDDYSTDETYQELERILRQNLHIPVSIIRNHSNLGPGLSRNIGWNAANCKWIAFLDADDAWHRQKLELQFQAIDKIPDIDLICSESILFAQVQESKEFPLDLAFTNISFDSSLFRNPVLTRSVVLKANIPFRFPKGLSEDYSLWLQCMNAGLKVIKLHAPLAFHFRPEFSKGGLSSNLLKHELYELKALSKYLHRSPIKVTLALIFSILKFFRRVLLSGTRKVSG